MNSSLFQQAIRAMALATRFSTVVVAGVFLGLWLDRRAGTGPLGLLSFALLGMILGTWHLLRDSQKGFHDPRISSSDSHDSGSGGDRA